MKTRNGFVSNSSSSSFVVHYRRNSWISPEEDKQTTLLSKDQLKKLKKFGFKYTSTKNPYFVNTDYSPYVNSLKKFSQYVDVYLGYDIICNQNNVICFLLENRIPFIALCHYDQELVVWDGKDENFYEMKNPVEFVALDMREGKFDKKNLTNPQVNVINVKQFIEDEKIPYEQ